MLKMISRKGKVTFNRIIHTGSSVCFTLGGGDSILKGNAKFFSRNFLWFNRLMIACNEDIITAKDALNSFFFLLSVSCWCLLPLMRWVLLEHGEQASLCWKGEVPISSTHIWVNTRLKSILPLRYIF